MQTKEQFPLPEQAGDKTANVVSGLGILAALAALAGASCCVLPLLLAIGGIGGAWVANLGVLTPYQPYILSFAGVLVLVGWIVAFRRDARRRTLIVLSAATALIVVAMVVAANEKSLTQYLFVLWRDG